MQLTGRRVGYNALERCGEGGAIMHLKGVERVGL